MSSVVAAGPGTAAEDGTGTAIAKAEDPADKPEFHDAHCLSFFFLPFSDFSYGMRYYPAVYLESSVYQSIKLL